MNYTDYLAQPVQDAQEEQQAQPVQANRLDIVAAQLAGEKLYSLQAEAREAIESEAEPSALAAKLTAVIFGEDSPEAGAVADMIKTTRMPGGYELAIEKARQRRALFKKQLDKLAEQEKEIAAQMGLAASEERELMEREAAANTANGALLAALDFSRELAADADPGATIRQAGELYEQHSGNRAAIGLLLGSLTDWQGQRGAALDLVQQQELQELKEKLATAASR